MAHNRLALNGERFGRLYVAVLYDVQRSSPGEAFTRWLCWCDCGENAIVGGTLLRTGQTRSCGCIKRELMVCRNATHGRSNTRTWRIWRGMIARCKYPSVRQYLDYGGRGITVCERWLTFENFLADMGECPAGMSIDRENNDGNYEPWNCAWSTRATQARNTSRNRFIEYQGRRLCLTDWAAELGITHTALANRLKRLPLEQAMVAGRFK